MEQVNQNSIINEIDELYEREAKEKRVLAQLLERYTNLQGRYLATRGEMGVHTTAGGKQFRTPSFVVSHDLSWLASHMKMGSEMSFMRTYIGNDGKLKIDESNVDELKQRQPDWSRQASLTAYLVADKMRKFGTILAVVSPDWVNQPEHENWGRDGRALKGAIQFEPLDQQGRVGLLNLSEGFVYALDGQHRVMGIRGVKELIENHFTLKNKHGIGDAEKVPQEEFLNFFNLELGQLESLLSERMHVEYIPAVLAGETREEASRRLRSVFFAINSHAKKPTKGENLTLDEVDGYSLVARRVGVRHSLFKGSSGSRINWKGSSLPERSEWFTTLEALKEMTRVFLEKANPGLAKRWHPPVELGIKSAIFRPPEDELDAASVQVTEFFGHMMMLPVFQGLLASTEVTKELAEARAFPDADSEYPNGRGHLLLRPVGQIVLAAAVGRLVNPSAKDRMTVEEVFKIISQLDSAGRFEAHRPENIWYGVTYNFHKKKMDVALSHRELAIRLLMYLVRGADEAERISLLREVISKREVEGSWLPFSGGKPVSVQKDESGLISVVGHNLPLPRQ